MSFKVPEKFRITTGPLGSNESFGNNGAFWVKTKKCVFTVIASDQMGWEHVSVSLPVRCPTWEEMCFIKSLFWDEDDCVIQYHPPKSDYVNNHPYCLHMWRPTEQSLPMPPSFMVGMARCRMKHPLDNKTILLICLIALICLCVVASGSESKNFALGWV